jgi:hypothetical protein
MELLLNNAPLAEHAAITEWQAVELACLPPAGVTLALSIGGELLEAFLRPGEALWHWRWNPQNAVGSHTLELHAHWPDGTQQQMAYRLEVLPRKLDAEHYELLLEELEAAAWRVLLALRGPSLGAAVGNPGEPDPAEAIASLFGERFAPFVAAVERLARRPTTRLQATLEQVQPGLAHDFSQVGARPGRLDPAARAEQRRPQQPASLVQQFATIAQPGSSGSYATYEYRLLLRLLGALRLRAQNLLRTPGLPAHSRERLVQAHKQLAELRQLPTFAGITPLPTFHGPSPLMQRDPDFRIVYRMWQSLRRHGQIALESPLFSLPIQELPHLYECWSALSLALALLQLPDWQLADQQLLAGESDQFTLDLTSERPLLTLSNASGARLLLYYQPRYRPISNFQSSLGSLDRHTRIPDLVIELQAPGAAPALLICDAKYRLEASGGLPEAALADAYVYLGSIGEASGQRRGVAAWLFYPGQGAEERYPSGVGALSLLPGDDKLGPWLAREIGRMREMIAFDKLSP